LRDLGGAAGLLGAVQRGAALGAVVVPHRDGVAVAERRQHLVRDTFRVKHGQPTGLRENVDLLAGGGLGDAQRPPHGRRPAGVEVEEHGEAAAVAGGVVDVVGEAGAAAGVHGEHGVGPLVHALQPLHLQVQYMQW